MFPRISNLLCASIIALATTANAAFVADDFDGPNLGSQWTFGGATVDQSTYTLTSGRFVHTPAPGSDLWISANTHSYIEQDAPAGTNWEVVTKIDNYDPTQPGHQRDFTRGGLQLWQDDNHQIVLSLISNGDGTQLATQTFYESAPTPADNGGLLYSSFLDIPNIGIQPSYWLKLQKTPKGYLGFYSSDNTTWINFMSIVKNRETTDGYFQNEKIRLFGAGGFGAGDVTPMEFDYIHVNTLPPPVSGYADDEFNSTTLGPQWGYHPGYPFGTLGFFEGKLMMTAGGGAQFWEQQDRSMHVYQDAPTSPSYAVTIKGSPTDMVIDDFTYELFSSYGVWLWRDNFTWGTIMNQRGDFNQGGTWLPNNRIEVAFKFNGQFRVTNVAFGTEPLPEYLRLEKVGDQVRAQYSFNNVDWTTIDIGGATSFFIGADNHQVRLFNKRVFNDGAPIDAGFDWVRVSPASSSNVSDWQIY